MKIYKKVGKKVFKKAKKSTVIKKPYASKALRKIIQTEIHKDIEDKQAYKTLELASYNSVIDTQGDCSTVPPQIGVGTGTANRIGAEIRLKSLNIKGYIMAKSGFNQVNQSRLGIRMLIVQPKAYNGRDAVYDNYSSWLPVLLRKGGTPSPFSGNISDWLAPINSDAITTYYDKRFIIEKPVQFTGVGELLSYQSTRFFNINLKVKNKLLRYDETVNSGTTPTNWCPVILLGYCYLDGTTPDTVTTQLSLAYDTVMKFEDA